MRHLAADDWLLWRQLRLEALEEAGYAFSSTLADWQGDGDTESRWRARLTTVPCNIIAWLDGKPAGMLSVTEADDDATVELISMWVAPFARGHSVGDALVSRAIDCARERSAAVIALDVVANNQRATNLYARHGFEDVGSSEIIDSQPSCERRMERRLRAIETCRTR